MAGEYRHATIAQRALASPQRPRLVAATLLVHAALAALVTATAFALGAAIAAPLLASKDLSTGLTGGELAQVGAEKLIGPALGPAGDYLPYALLNSLLELDGPLSVGLAAMALTTTAGAVCCLAATTAARRDIV